MDDHDVPVVTNIVDDMSDNSIAEKLLNFISDKKLKECQVLIETQLKNSSRNWDYIFNGWKSEDKSILFHCIEETGKGKEEEKEEFTSIVKLILTNGGNPNSRCVYLCPNPFYSKIIRPLNKSPLWRAVELKEISIIKLLILFGADRNEKQMCDKLTMTLFQNAVLTQDVETIKTFLETETTVNININTTAHDEEDSNNSNDGDDELKSREFKWEENLNTIIKSDIGDTGATIEPLLTRMIRQFNSGFELNKCLEYLLSCKKIQLNFHERDIIFLCKRQQGSFTFESTINIVKEFLSKNKEYYGIKKCETILNIIKYHDIVVEFYDILESKNDHKLDLFINNKFLPKFVNQADKDDLTFIINEWNTWDFMDNPDLPKMNWSYSKESPLLIYAIQGGFDAGVTVLIEKLKADPNIGCECGWYSLLLQKLLYNVKILEYLLDHGANPNLFDIEDNYNNLLYHICGHARFDLLQLVCNPKYKLDCQSMIKTIEYDLQEKKKDEEEEEERERKRKVKNKKGRNLIELFCCSDSFLSSYQCLEYLFDLQFKENFQYKMIITPGAIESAVNMNKERMLNLLLDRSQSDYDDNNATFNRIDEIMYNKKIVSQLFKILNVNITTKIKLQRQEKLEKGKECLKIIETVINNKDGRLNWDSIFNNVFELNVKKYKKDYKRQYLFPFIVDATNDIKLVKLLLELGADPNKWIQEDKKYTGESKLTPPACLSACGLDDNGNMIKLLLEYGADINICWKKEENELNALDYACNYPPNVEVVKRILEDKNNLKFDWNKAMKIESLHHKMIKSLLYPSWDPRDSVSDRQKCRCLSYLFDFQREKKIKIDFPDKDNDSLKNLVKHGFSDTVELICQNLDQYINYKNGKVFEIMWKLFCEVNKQVVANALYFWSKNGNIAMLEAACNAFPDDCMRLGRAKCNKRCEKLTPIVVARLFDQNKCAEWMKTGKFKDMFSDNDNKNGDDVSFEDSDFSHWLFQLIDGGCKKMTIDLMNTLMNNNSGIKVNWSDIINKAKKNRDKNEKGGLLQIATKKGLVEVVEYILSIKNIQFEFISESLFSLCGIDSRRHRSSDAMCKKLMKLLLDNGADPNFKYDELTTVACVVSACSQMQDPINVDLIRMLMENSKFDWNSAHSISYRKSGDYKAPNCGLFELLCCNFDKQDFNDARAKLVKLLFEIKDKHKTDARYSAPVITDDFKAYKELFHNGSRYAKKERKHEFEKSVYYSNAVNIINNLDYCSKNVISNMMQAESKRVMYLLARFGDFEAINKVIDAYPPHSKFNYIEVCYDEALPHFMKPIQTSYIFKQFECVEKMYKSKYFIENDSLDLLIQSDLNQFKKEFCQKIVTNKVTNWDQLLKQILIEENRVFKWINIVKNVNCDKSMMSTREKEETLSFLYELKNESFENNNFDKLVAMIDDNGEIVGNSSMNENWFEFRRNKKISHYVYNKLKGYNNNTSGNTNVLNLLSNIINNGISSNECPFTDSWLMLSKMINEKAFLQAIENCAQLGMPKVNLNTKDKMDSKKSEDDSDTVTTKISKKKDISENKHQTFFKNFVLSSNVFAEPLNDKSDKLVFDVISENVIELELLKQKKFIQESILKMEKQWSKDWKIMKNIREINIGENNNIQQNCLIDSTSVDKLDLMKEYGVKCKYNDENDLPKSNINQFNGSQIYDENEYLTSLLIQSHLINPSFQESCKNVFTCVIPNMLSNDPNVLSDKLGNYGIRYTKGNVKMRDRCIVKARLDYNDKLWPKTSNILDFLRCSIVCNDPQILSLTIKHFVDLVNTQQAGNIIKVVRIKNGFKNVSSNMSLQLFDYCDIKLNVLIEYNKMTIIGEIQFLLSFMLNAKKIGHSFYAFERKKEYFNYLNEMNNKLLNSNAKFIKNLLQTQILSQNKNIFSRLLHLLNEKEYKLLIENTSILDNLKQNQWKKGENIFKSIVA